MKNENSSQLRLTDSCSPISYDIKMIEMASDNRVSIQNNKKYKTLINNGALFQNAPFKTALNTGKALRKVSLTVKSESSILYWMATLMLPLCILSLIGLLFDDRTLMGVNVWVKPLKFFISTFIYFLTVGFLITKYPYSRTKKNLINHVTAWSLLFEVGIIAFQASRGVQSHYNITTLFDSILFMLMGVFVGINVLIIALFIVDTIRLKLKTTKPMQWAILLGWCVIFFGSWVGGQMIAQVSHNVGVADGGSGLPLINWSTIAGDLRIAHFFGIHGLQIIPLFVFYISKKWKSSNRNHIIAVTLFTLAYASWIGFTFFQAKQGMALLAQ